MLEGAYCRLHTRLPTTGCCIAASLHQQILDELYHEDKGFNNNYTVLLSERPPSRDVEHALATHSASKKISFLQGSPFRSEVRGVMACAGMARSLSTTSSLLLCTRGVRYDFCPGPCPDATSMAMTGSAQACGNSGFAKTSHLHCRTGNEPQWSTHPLCSSSRQNIRRTRRWPIAT